MLSKQSSTRNIVFGSMTALHVSHLITTRAILLFLAVQQHGFQVGFEVVFLAAVQSFLAGRRLVRFPLMKACQMIIVCHNTPEILQRYSFSERPAGQAAWVCNCTTTLFEAYVAIQAPDARLPAYTESARITAESSFPSTSNHRRAAAKPLNSAVLLDPTSAPMCPAAPTSVTTIPDVSS